jgi:hypothetical protein
MQRSSLAETASGELGWELRSFDIQADTCPFSAEDWCHLLRSAGQVSSAQDVAMWGSNGLFGNWAAVPLSCLLCPDDKVAGDLEGWLWALASHQKLTVTTLSCLFCRIVCLFVCVCVCVCVCERERERLRDRQTLRQRIWNMWSWAFLSVEKSWEVP